MQATELVIKNKKFIINSCQSGWEEAFEDITAAIRKHFTSVQFYRGLKRKDLQRFGKKN